MNIIKKKPLIFSFVIIVVLIFGVVWYYSPLKLLKLNSDEVSEISIFDGNTGTLLNITEKNDIDYIIKNLNSVKLKRGKVSIGYLGYSFKTTIYLTGGKEANGWNNFIISSNDMIRKDPFFYHVVEGSIDYEYIDKLIKESSNQ